MRRSRPLAVVLATVAMTHVLGVQPALAIPSCPGSHAYDFVSSAWYPNDNQVAGIRAPIETRKDGAVCSGGPTLGFAASWIAIEKSDASRITQIGFIHIYNSQLQTGQHCRFWAIGSGAVHTYGCGNQTDGIFIYFKILKFFDPDTRQNKYAIYDCGTNSNYSGCTVKNSSEVAYASAFGVVAAETNYGRSACTVRIMGSPGNKQNFGRTDHPIQGMHAIGDPWGVKSLTPSNAVCSNYDGDFANDIVLTWDSRNTN